jgi:hypothetical protein
MTIASVPPEVSGDQVERVKVVPFSSFPVIVKGRVVHAVMTPNPDGGWDPVLTFRGVHNDVRDNEIAARICALPLLVDAGHHAVKVAGMLDDKYGGTVATEGVLPQVKGWTGEVRLRLGEVLTAFRDQTSREDEARLISKLDVALCALAEWLCRAKDVLDHAVASYGDADAVFDRDLLSNAVDLAEWPDFLFENDDYKHFETWLVVSRDERLRRNEACRIAGEIA